MEFLRKIQTALAGYSVHGNGGILVRTTILPEARGVGLRIAIKRKQQPEDEVVLLLSLTKAKRYKLSLLHASLDKCLTPYNAQAKPIRGIDLISYGGMMITIGNIVNQIKVSINIESGKFTASTLRDMLAVKGCIDPEHQSPSGDIADEDM